MLQKGFTLIELVIVIAVIGIVAGVSMPVYASYSGRNDLANATEETSDLLRRSQTYARAGNGDSAWGVAMQANGATLFKGTSYASRDTTYDESVTFASGITTSGLTELYFSKLQGIPSTTGTIQLTGDKNVNTVTVNAKGLVTY